MDPTISRLIVAERQAGYRDAAHAERLLRAVRAAATCAAAALGGAATRPSDSVGTLGWDQAGR